MDILQIALVFLIMLLSIFLSILGIQVFFILKDLKKSLDKLDIILGDVEKPVKAAAGVVEAIKLASPKKVRRLFRRKG